MDTTRITTYPNPFLVNVPELQNVIQNAAGEETVLDLQTRIGQLEEMVIYDTKELAANTIRSFDTGQVQFLDPVVGDGNSNTIMTQDRSVTAFVNSGTPVSFQSLQVQVSSSGNRSLQIATTSGSLTADWNTYGTITGTYVSPNIVAGQVLTTTFVYIAPSHDYLSQGDVQHVIFCDKTNNIGYRITCMIGPSYVENMISVEQL
jgi:hypothetical protein